MHCVSGYAWMLSEVLANVNACSIQSTIPQVAEITSVVDICRAIDVVEDCAAVLVFRVYVIGNAEEKQQYF